MSLLRTWVNCKTLLALIGLWVCSLVTLPAWAQIAHSTPGTLKAETRKHKKEAATYEAEHKESHLNVTDFTYKKGKAGRRAVAVDAEPIDYNFDKDINSLYESPRTIKKNEKKKKKLLKGQKRKR